jgi:alkylation response protein AidB-like acyl-CoA dehydrogenase
MLPPRPSAAVGAPFGGGPELVERARALRAVAARHAEPSERERRLAPEVVDALADAGLLSMLVPRSLGGGEASPAELVGAIAEIARGDGSAGWCTAIAATSGALAAYLPEPHAHEVYGPGARCWGGVFAPRGRAVRDGDALRVSGRWPWATGSQHCDWLMGGCVLEQDGITATLPSGRPDVRLVLFPAAEVQIIDTWHASGLRGTGSHDMAVRDVEVPVGRAPSVLVDSPRERGPLYAFPLFGLLALALAAAGLGIARGAVDDLHGLAGTKQPTLGARTLAARSDTQGRLARAEARLRGARALVEETVAEAWERAHGDGAVPIEQRAALRLAATHAMAESAAVVDEMYALAGGSAVFESSPLQRRFRDVHVATQHMLVGPSAWELAGRVLLGVPADTDQL